MNETDTLFDPATNSSSASNNNNTTIIINGQEYSAACIDYLQSILSSDELSSAIIHCSTSVENEAFDSWGLQGGQQWTDPTPPPSKPPSIKPTSLSSQPTASPAKALPPPSSSPSLSPSLSYPPSGGEPTYYPTLHSKLFVLRGTIYYDRNANGSRDANVATDEFGPDTEYNVGLGGVNLRLVECDLDTNEAVDEMVSGDKKQQQGDDGEEEGESGWNSYSSTISQGYDVLFRPVLADRGVDGGKYNMINIKVNRAYYIEAEAPVGFLFTGGVCNNAVPGWACPKPTTAGSFSAVGGGTSTNMKSLNAEQRESFSEKFLNNQGEDALGLRVGRSTRCVSVDRTGKVDGNLDLGVMRSGDVKLDKTEVRVTLDLGDVENSIKEMHIKDDNGEGGNRRLSILQRLLSVFSNDNDNENQQSLQDRILRGATHLGNNRYLLQDSDQYAIGVVTSEVLASSLDVALAANGVELDHIMHKDVILSLESSQASEVVADGEEAFEESNAASSSFSSSSSSSSSASDGASDSDVHDKSEGLRRNLATNDNSNTRPNNNNNGNSSTRPNNSQPTYNSRNPAPRRQNRLTVDLEVWGHYPPQLNVDFDYIVQDSINAQTDAIRAELVDYNANCEDQTELVADHGYVMDDFEEIYSNKGVTSNTRMKRERNAARQQQLLQGEDSSTTLDDAVMAASEEVESKVFRTACSNEIKLPEYFEESLKTIEATKVEAVTILEEPSATPFTMIGILAALMVVMLVGAFFVFRMGFKKKSADEEDDLDDYSYDEEDTKYGSQSYASQSYASKSKCDISESDRKCKAKMESYRSGGPFDAPAPIPVRPPSNFISAAVSQVGEGIASRFKFGGRSKLDKSQTSSEKHEAYARKVSTNAPVEKMALDESESIADPTKALDDDQIAADERIKDFERRMRTMKQSAIIQKKLEAQDFDQSTVSSRPSVPVDIKFAAAQLASKNSGSTGKGSSDDDESSSSSSSGSSSSSSDSSAPVKKRKKKVVANKKNGKVSSRVT